MFPLVLALMQAVSVPKPAPVQCNLHLKSPEHWAGVCVGLFGDTASLTLESEAGISTGRWRSDLQPEQVWRGTMQSTKGSDPIELEVYTLGRTNLRTQYGWYSVPTYHEHSDVLTFAVDTGATVPPSDLDRAIVKRADALLASTAVWNRSDNRKCPAGAKLLSIYCAMEQAALDVTGGTHHRRPAMELVRTIVDDRTKDRDYSHRLMDYNNDPKTTIADVRSLFAEALSKMGGGDKVAARAPASAPVATAPPMAAAQQLRIIDRAEQLLNSADKWNRVETQKCAADAKTFGLFCVLTKASQDVAGSVDDESPILSDARTIVDFIAVKRYAARLVNYNNDPTTTFSDIQAFLHILRNHAIKRSSAGAGSE